MVDKKSGIIQINPLKPHLNMIYLIGGPPKCGKTTLAKKLSKKLKVPFVSTDTLEVVTMEYVWKYAPDKFDTLYPHSASKGKNNDETYSKTSPKQIAKYYFKQAKATHSAIDSFSICEISDGNDFIIEGYHITPQLVASLFKKYGKENFKTVFLVKTDTTKFLQNIKNSSTPNDWILAKTKNKKLFTKSQK
jgi:2-phosphoglycerate kinase